MTARQKCHTINEGMERGFPSMISLKSRINNQEQAWFKVGYILWALLCFCYTHTSCSANSNVPENFPVSMVNLCFPEEEHIASLSSGKL